MLNAIFPEQIVKGFLEHSKDSCIKCLKALCFQFKNDIKCVDLRGGFLVKQMI
jgi:hypothetical protein